MPRGGRRRGTPGTAYGNRTDLNMPEPLPVQTAPSTGYGKRVAQERAQQAVPLAPAPTAPPAAPQAPIPAAPMPGSFGDFLRPTERDQEPLTSGIDSGPGPGSEALALDAGADAEAVLRQLYLRSPSEELREVLEALDT